MISAINFLLYFMIKVSNRHRHHECTDLYSRIAEEFCKLELSDNGYQSPSDYFCWNYISDDTPESASFRVYYPSLVGHNYAIKFECNGGCSGIKWYNCFSFKVDKPFVESIQMSLQLFLEKKTIGFCGICGSSEVTDCQVVTYHFPKLFMVDISNFQVQKDSAINQLDDELSMFGLQLILFGVIYYDTKRKHFVTRHRRLDKSGDFVYFHYDGMSDKGNYRIVVNGPFFPRVESAKALVATHCFYIRQDDSLPIEQYNRQKNSLVDLSAVTEDISVEDFMIKSTVKESLSGVNEVYKAIRKRSGDIGGNGSGGPMYGEITESSMDGIVNYLVRSCNLSKDSKFLDIGSGLGKPSLHVMASVDPSLSVGIESEKVRFDLSISNLCAVHHLSGIFENISGRCFFCTWIAHH